MVWCYSSIHVWKFNSAIVAILFTLSNNEHLHNTKWLFNKCLHKMTLWTWLKQEADFPNCSLDLLLLGLQPFCCCFRDSFSLLNIHYFFPFYKWWTNSYFSVIVEYYIPVPLLKRRPSHLLDFFPQQICRENFCRPKENHKNEQWRLNLSPGNTNEATNLWLLLLTGFSSLLLNTARLRARKERCIPVNFKHRAGSHHPVSDWKKKLKLGTIMLLYTTPPPPAAT